MKKLLIIVFACLLSVLAFAEKENMSVKKIEESCKQVQNNINFLKNRLDDVKNAQIIKLREANPSYDLKELERLNDGILGKSTELIKEIPKFYSRDTVSNTALLALEDVNKVLNEYHNINFNKDNEIKISDEFSTKIQELNDKLKEVQETIALPQTEDRQETSEDSEENMLSNQFVLFGGVCILIIMVVICLVYVIVLLTRLTRLKSRVDGFDGYLNLKTDGLNIKIENLQKDIDLLKNKIETNKKDGNRKIDYSTNASGDIYSKCQRLVEDLRAEVRKEINDIRIQMSSAHEKSSDIVSSMVHKEQPGIIENIVGITAEGGCTEHEQQPSKAKAKKIFAQLQNNGTFKVYDDDKRTAFFVIIQDSSEASTASFELKELNADDMQSAIANRTTLLTPACDIESMTPTPKKIKVLQSGIAIKNGKDWTVREKAIISLE